jgi:hypothetical protein
MVQHLRRVTAGVASRLMIVILFAGTALILVTWFGWEQTYPRQMATVIFWAPLVVSVWFLGTIALFAMGRSRLGLVYAVSLPLSGIALAAASLELAADRTAGLVGLIALLAGFDLAMLFVLHQLLG